jgi:cytosine permease
VLTNTWLLIILTDYFVCRRWLRLGRTEGIEFRENEVRTWNPCGLISLSVAVAVGALGIIGVYPTYYASYLVMVIGPLLHVAITAATKGRYYEPAHASAKHEVDS